MRGRFVSVNGAAPAGVWKKRPDGEISRVRRHERFYAQAKTESGKGD